MTTSPYEQEISREKSRFKEVEVEERKPPPGFAGIPPSAAMPGYERLYDTLMGALEQAARGKGKERHAREGEAFEDQPMQKISELLGSVDGMAFQAIKKLREGINLPTHEARVNELRGVINYVAGIIIYLESENDRNKNRNRPNPDRG